MDGWIGGLVVNGQETGGGGRAGRGRENRSCTGLTSQQNSVKVDVSPPCRVQERVVTSDRFYIEDCEFFYLQGFIIFTERVITVSPAPVREQLNVKVT